MPIRRPLTPKTIPHTVTSGTEFATGHAVRVLPRRSAEAALGRQRGPPRIDLKAAPGTAEASPTMQRHRGGAQRRPWPRPAGWCSPASQSRGSGNRLLEWRPPKPRARRYLRALRQPRGQRRAARPAAALRLPLGERARAYPSVHVQHELQAHPARQTCKSEGIGLRPRCTHGKKAQQRPATR